MKGEPKVIEYLNKALRHELTAVNQYWLHYRLLDNWGYKDLAKQWRKESIEEMEHADTLIERIIFLDGFPNMQVLDPLHIGQTVKEVLDCDLAAEMSARALYQEAATHCHAVKDYVTPRSVREADARRGGPHRLPRNPARSRRQARPRALRPVSHRRHREPRLSSRLSGRSGLTRPRSPMRKPSKPSWRRYGEPTWWSTRNGLFPAPVVLDYLSRYTHRVATSNSLLIASGADGVTFK